MNSIINLEFNSIYDQYMISIIDENYTFMKLIVEESDYKSFYNKFIDIINKLIKTVSNFFKEIIKRIKNKFIEIRNKLLSKIIDSKLIEKRYKFVLDYCDKIKHLNESEDPLVKYRDDIENELLSLDLTYFSIYQINKFKDKQKEIIEDKFKYYDNLNNIYKKYNKLNTDPHNYTVGNKNKELFIVYEELNNSLSNIPKIENKTTNSIEPQKITSSANLIDDIMNKNGLYNKNTTQKLINEMKDVETRVLSTMDELKLNLNNDLDNMIIILKKNINSEEKIDKIIKDRLKELFDTRVKLVTNAIKLTNETTKSLMADIYLYYDIINIAKVKNTSILISLNNIISKYSY